MDKLTLTIFEAAKMMGISKHTAYNYAKKNRLPTLVLGRKILVSRRALQILLETPPGWQVESPRGELQKEQPPG